MGNGKIQLRDGATLIDLTGDTVTPAKLAKGVTAHDAKGDPITGTMDGGGADPVLDVLSPITPTETMQTFDTENDGFASPITVNPIPDAYIIPTGELTVTENGTVDVAAYAALQVDTLKIATGTFTNTSAVYTQRFHTGFEPKLFYLIVSERTNTNTSTSYIAYSCYSYSAQEQNGDPYTYSWTTYTYKILGGNQYVYDAATGDFVWNNTTGKYPLYANKQYTWIAVA